MPVIENAHAKINLLLAVTAKRPDGYHELKTIYQSLALHDTLTFTEKTENQITLSCDDPSLPAASDNLVWRAAERLKLLYGIKQGVHIRLEKKIPVAAGLAGGSSDAAATLRGLVRLWRLPWEMERISELAAELGSDVPFCLQQGTALGTGRGEQITVLAPCPLFYVVLANPGFPVSTASIYTALHKDDFRASSDLPGMIDAIKKSSRQGIIGCLANTLELPAFRLYPAVARLKRVMNDCTSALMCGSGPTVFALFSSLREAEALADRLSHEKINVWLTHSAQPGIIGGLPND